jgi:two-component system, OmpR family, sensor histidine kinase MtrB
MRKAEQSSRPSLRLLSRASVGFIGLYAFLVIMGLVLGSTLLIRSIDTVEDDVRGVARATALDRALRDYHRLANLRVAERDPAIEEVRASLEAELYHTIDEAAIASDTPQEAQLVASFYTEVAAYVTQRAALEARGLTLEELAPRLRPGLEQALASSDTLRWFYEDRLRDNHASVDAIARAMLISSGLAVLLLLGTLVGVAGGVQRLVLGPLAAVRATMESFVGGDTQARAPEDGSRELVEVAQTFNGMADTIEQRRTDLLAFLGGIAHDLRNPISALKLSWQSLIRHPEPMDNAQLERLDRQLDRLARMIDDLLDAVRIEAGQLELEPEDMDLRSAARDMVALYGPTSAAHTVTLEAPEQPVEIRADPLRIEQVISNLVNNAIKYSPGGGPVGVRVGFADAEAELEVSDRGVGISPETLPELFVAFRRGTDTKQVAMGAGLGLSVVHRIVTAHGGRIDVESTPGEGSTFRVRLPLSPRTRADD